MPASNSCTGGEGRGKGFVFANDFRVKHIGCVRLGNPDLDLKIWIFGFPIEHKIRKLDEISKKIKVDHR